VNSNKHKPYKDARRSKIVFWQTDTGTSRWLKLVKDVTQDLKPRASRRLGEIKDWQIKD